MVEIQVRRRDISLIEGKKQMSHIPSSALPYFLPLKKALCEAVRAIQTMQYEHVALFCDFSSSHHLSPSMRKVCKLSPIVS